MKVYWAACILSCGSNMTKASERNQPVFNMIQLYLLLISFRQDILRRDRTSTDFMKQNFKFSLQLNICNCWLRNYGCVCWKYLQYQWLPVSRISHTFSYSPFVPLKPNSDENISTVVIFFQFKKVYLNTREMCLYLLPKLFYVCNSWCKVI